MKKSTQQTRVAESQVTPESIFWNRRQFIQKFGLATSYLGMMGIAPVNAESNSGLSGLALKDELSSEYVITHHNNFYEFSTDKKKPAELAKNFTPGNDWRVAIEGEIEKPGEYTLEDILKWVQLEERIYRLRCVEAWSMVVPWTGFELSTLIKHVKPTSKAKYIEFKTLHDPKVFPGQKRGLFGMHSLPWPYVEGLTIEEAMNPLTLMATGVYGKNLPGQNGAPLRLVVPWKYGFKSIKSVVSIRFSETQPVNTWNKRARREYGFYANVNPNVDHPRWSQATERRITDESFFGVKKIPTQMFNGYADQVAHLYKGLDLTRFY
ncbi:protein-methionine-sulfoxide reductase catalytic subunit MsrP [Aliikangiella coralliicola]|uniref:Protein-methionine-sulfoxide reductase catalytic subunit MsrP n=1 Tax=Aliikangiella coralliicola TaxID=2592383 RepID=A0A545TWI1_9GAMM|nr:protein-methionine-sulfoxide reductase catalytic subunit MsrP [Aliikangiella coralliicola]TQV81578.1 protein-methionine-sulfoxide reductase catalytic subunit MsrP [Aliikangiella coralliicola]